jgi:hypothetical protein
MQSITYVSDYARRDLADKYRRPGSWTVENVPAPILDDLPG